MNPDYEVAVVGGGPAGATCAALCAQGGRRTLLLERATFPRDKVCGDCLNPSCWPVLERLGVVADLLAAPHSVLESVEYVGTDDFTMRFALPVQARGELTIRRRVLDQLLLQRARTCGATVLENTVVTAVEPGWKLTTPTGKFTVRTLVAADGRNSTVARLLGLLPTARKDRLAQQTHFPAPTGFGHKVAMRFTPWGYCGLATIDGGLANLCLVSRPGRLRLDPALGGAHLWAAA
ncbi:MAG: NAD(P)/FAD-dependent oxidoreductase [Chthoniobacteraceae bacterium]